MHISLEGPQEEDAVEMVEAAGKTWFKSGQRQRRPTIKPYGKGALPSQSAAPTADLCSTEFDSDSYE